MELWRFLFRVVAFISQRYSEYRPLPSPCFLQNSLPHSIFYFMTTIRVVHLSNIPITRFEWEI